MSKPTKYCYTAKVTYKGEVTLLSRDSEPSYGEVLQAFRDGCGVLYNPHNPLITDVKAVYPGEVVNSSTDYKCSAHGEVFKKEID